MDLGLRDRAFIVSGGSRGIGFATAQVLVAEGARVVLGARDPVRLREAAGELGVASAEGVLSDLAEPRSATDLVAAALARFGRLDGALISVGGPPGSSPLGTSDEAWTAAFSSVFLGPARLGRAVGTHLVGLPGAELASAGERGALCFVLSTSAISPITGLTTSNALRPALAMHVKDLADELGPSRVRVTGILPGRIATDRVRELDAATGDPAAAEAAAVARIPLCRYGEPGEAGRVAAFLLSPAASYVSGACVPVDGGAVRAL